MERYKSNIYIETPLDESVQNVNNIVVCDDVSGAIMLHRENYFSEQHMTQEMGNIVKSLMIAGYKCIVNCINTELYEIRYNYKDTMLRWLTNDESDMIDKHRSSICTEAVKSLISTEDYSIESRRR